MISACKIAFIVALSALLSRVVSADPAPSTNRKVSIIKPAVRIVAKSSLAAQSADEAWKTPGFRLQLGLGYGRFMGLGGAPGGRLLGPIIRVGVRLDPRWSLQTSWQYLAANGPEAIAGLRYSGTIEPTFHFSKRLSFSLGVGFGGIVEGGTLRNDPRPDPSDPTTSYTFLDAKTPLANCSGEGASALARIDWLAVLGQRTATGFAFELGGQWTGCIEETDVVDPITSEAIVRRQWWPHIAATFAWLVAWR